LCSGLGAASDFRIAGLRRRVFYSSALAVVELRSTKPALVTIRCCRNVHCNCDSPGEVAFAASVPKHRLHWIGVLRSLALHPEVLGAGTGSACTAGRLFREISDRSRADI